MRSSDSFSRIKFIRSDLNNSIIAAQSNFKTFLKQNFPEENKNNNENEEQNSKQHIKIPNLSRKLSLKLPMKNKSLVLKPKAGFQQELYHIPQSSKVLPSLNLNQSTTNSLIEYNTMTPFARPIPKDSLYSHIDQLCNESLSSSKQCMQSFKLFQFNACPKRKKKRKQIRLIKPDKQNHFIYPPDGSTKVKYLSLNKKNVFRMSDMAESLNYDVSFNQRDKVIDSYKIEDFRSEIFNFPLKKKKEIKLKPNSKEKQSSFIHQVKELNDKIKMSKFDFDLYYSKIKKQKDSSI